MGFGKEITKGMRLIQRNAELIPAPVLKGCSGLVVLQQVKGAFFWSGSLASGFVVKKLLDGKWGPPSAVLLASGGFGFQFGFEKIDIVLVLNDSSAVNVFERSGHLKLGAEYSVSVGPVGADVSGDVRAGAGGFTGTFSYCTSKGLFAGISLDGGVIITNTSRNRSFYGKAYHVKKILNNDIPLTSKPAEKCRQLSHFLMEACEGQLAVSGRIRPVLEEGEEEKLREYNRKKLVEIYTVYNPEKIKIIDLLLDKYKGREDQLFADIEEKYGGEDNPNVVHVESNEGQKEDLAKGPPAEEHTHEEEEHMELEDDDLKSLENIFANASLNASTQSPLKPVAASSVDISNEANALRSELEGAYAAVATSTPSEGPKPFPYNEQGMDSAPQETKTISVVVPQGVGPGDTFSMRAEDGQIFAVQCPETGQAGQWIDVRVPVGLESSQHIAINPKPLKRQSSDLIHFT